MEGVVKVMLGGWWSQSAVAKTKGRVEQTQDLFQPHALQMVPIDTKQERENSKTTRLGVDNSLWGEHGGKFRHEVCIR